MFSRQMAPFAVLALVLFAPAAPAGAAEKKDPPRSAGELEAQEKKTTEEERLRRGDRSRFTSEQLLRRAAQFLERTGRRSEAGARRLFDTVLSREPANAVAMAGLARCAMTRYLRRWEEDDRLIEVSLGLARSALLADPEEPRAHAALAVASMADGNWEAAREAGERAWALRGPEPDPWVTRIYIRLLLTGRRWEEAGTAVEEALARHPLDPRLHLLKGNLLLDRSELYEAEDSFRRALLLEQDLIPAVLSLARIQMRTGKGGLSAHLYQQVAERFPEEKGRVHVIWAASLIEKGKHKQALDGLGEVNFETGRGLGEGTRLYLMARCHEELGEKEQAIELYRRVIDEYPFATYGIFSTTLLAAESVERLARIALEDSRQTDALGLLEAALSMPRPSLGIFLRLGDLYSSYGLHREAATALARTEEIPDGPRMTMERLGIYVAWARALEKTGQGSPDPRREVVDALRNRSEGILATGNAGFFLEAARACAIAGDVEESLRWLDRAVEVGHRQLDWIRRDPEMRPVAESKKFSDLMKRASAR